MSEFRTLLKLEDDADGITMVLDQPLVYYSDLLQREITVPKGFDTDFASIPKFLWNILPQHGPYDRAAVVHDYLYRYGGVDRGQADAILRESMQVCNVPARQVRIIYIGVRLGGWVPWRRYRNAAH